MTLSCDAATALGPDRTREELIPFISSSTDDDDDEVLRTIAERVGGLACCVGGDAYSHKVLAPLELLLAVEENSVRDAAVASIHTVLSKMSNEHVVAHYVPFLRRLATKDWFSSRISAAELFHVAMSRMPEAERVPLAALFLKLCRDDTPLVRRVAAQYLGSVAGGLQPAVAGDFVGAFIALVGDEQDSVRIQAIMHCSSLLERLAAENKVRQVLPLVLESAHDKSWRVRWALSNSLHGICRVASDSSSLAAFGSAFQGLLGDTEPEVRAAAAGIIAEMARLLRKEQTVSRVLPSLQRLVSDPSERVRAVLSTAINGLAADMSKEDTVDLLLPLLLQLLRDENSEVRLNVVSNLASINKTIGAALLSQSLLPAVVELASDVKWRVRLAIIESVPLLATQLGREFFTEKLSALCAQWLVDEVYSVRRAAIANLLALAEGPLDAAWAADFVLPCMVQLQSSPNYLLRTTCVYLAHAMLRAVPAQLVQSTVIPLLLRLAADNVPNVRFAAARAMHLMAEEEQLLRKVGAALVHEMRRCLDEQAGDSDRDVSFYAKGALMALGQ